MSTPEHSEQEAVRNEKRQQFQRSPSGPPRGVFLAIALIVAAFMGIWFLATGSGQQDTPDSPPDRVAVPHTQAEVRIPLASLSDGTAQFHVYQARDKPIRFFALKGGDGAYRVALDACEVCYHAKKGYYQNGEEMVCRQCGNSYPPALIDEAPGGCHPVALPREVAGADLLIRGSDIEKAEARLAAMPPPRPRSESFR